MGGGLSTKFQKEKKKKYEETCDGKPCPVPDLSSPPSDDLTQIPESKTFLAVFSSKLMHVRWCQKIAYPQGNNALQPATTSVAAAAYSDNSDLWHAFHAGAMWAMNAMAAQNGRHQV